MKAVRIVPIVAIIAVIIYLGSTSFQEALTYYVTASEFKAQPENYSGKTIKIAGWVLEGSIVKDIADPLSLNFTVRESGIHIPVRYTGLAPDTFKDNSEVVVTGKWNGTVFESHEILAKCASKYTEQMEEVDP